MNRGMMQRIISYLFNGADWEPTDKYETITINDTLYTYLYLWDESWVGQQKSMTFYQEEDNREDFRRLFLEQRPQ